jgi:serine/threonine-protein kinase
MRLDVPARLHHYEILAFLGAGGMGEVYRAKDTSLGREVALKLLQFSDDSESLPRFKREARLLASLSHSGIAAIHGLEEFEGTHFLVLELVPGETMAERIARGRIPQREGLVFFQQIAEALEAAHAKGIVHRDLKPANVKVTTEGKTKLLDFGLAKAYAGEEAASDLSQSPTYTRGGTREGVILGTPAYLSPEQARGKPVDNRTDIWAFGCLLYEALSGKPAFLGETISDTLANILDREPDWKALPSETPWVIRRLLRRCLEKDARRRLQAIGDARIDIEEALAGRADDPAATSGDPRPARSTGNRISPWLVAGLVAILAGWAVLWMRPPPSAEVVSTRLGIELPAEAPLAPAASMPLGNARSTLALSRDGRRLVYVALWKGRRQLFLRDMTTGEIKPVPGTEGAHTPFFSPDGEWVAFYADGKLKKVALASDEIVVLADSSSPAGGSWGDDDVLYFITNEGAGISRVPASSGKVQLTVPGQFLWPETLPSGRGLLFSDLRGGIHLLAGDRIERITSRGGFPRYAPSGHLVYGNLGKMIALPFDLSTLQVTGPAVTLFQDLRTDIFGGAQFTVSQNGVLVYLSGMDSQVASLVWVDRHGKTENLDLPRAIYGPFDISPDGRELAIPVFDDSAADIWIYDISRGTRTRFTFPTVAGAPSLNTNPRWTPDGKHIVYSSGLQASESSDLIFRLFWKPADGSREGVPLTSDDSLQRSNAISFSPDGSVLAFYATAPDTGFDLWTLSLKDTDPYRGVRAKPQPFLRTPFLESFPSFSPDGKWIAYMSDEAGSREIYVRPFPGPGGKIQISTGNGTRPSWHPSGREIFYQSGTQWYAASVTLSPDFKAEKPRLLFEGPFINIPGFAYALARDGERFLVLANPEQFETRRDLTVVTNFFDLLRRRVPGEN